MIPLLRRIELILWEEWDPIGVNDCEGAEDEYDSYASGIYAMFQTPTRPSLVELCAYLGRIQTEHMGLNHTPDHNEEVAGLLAGL
jgi:hypothetical protein